MVPSPLTSPASVTSSVNMCRWTVLPANEDDQRARPANLHERSGLTVGAAGGKRPALLDRQPVTVTRQNARDSRLQRASGCRPDKDAEERRRLPGGEVPGRDRHTRGAHAAGFRDAARASADRVCRDGCSSLAIEARAVTSRSRHTILHVPVSETSPPLHAPQSLHRVESRVRHAPRFMIGYRDSAAITAFTRYHRLARPAILGG